MGETGGRFGGVERDLPSSDPGPEPNSGSTGGEDRAQEGRATLIENTQGESKAKGAKRRESERASERRVRSGGLTVKKSCVGCGAIVQFRRV